MYPHRIRLRGPWEFDYRIGPESDDWLPLFPHRKAVPWDALPEAWDKGIQQLQLPAQVRARRRFGYPGRIDAHERVWLTFDGTPPSAAIHLNAHLLGRPAGGDEQSEYEVTGLLKAHNELQIEFPTEGQTGMPLRETALEVRANAFLRNVRLSSEVRRDGTILHAVGEVVGECERPLELYVILGRTNVAYARVEAHPAGRPFEVASEPLATQPPGSWHAVRVELVNGSVVWYALERELQFANPG